MEIKNLLQNCYVPYSQEPNMAIVETSSGHFYPGVRVENLSFPLTISAIQNAVYCCLSEGKVPSKLFANGQSNPLTSFWVDEYNLSIQPLDKKATITFNEVVINDVSQQTTLHKLLERSVVDNSHFPVACLLETNEGFISGVNIENSEWTAGLCAERVALAKAFSYGITEFKSLHITAQKGEYCSPCGACRQVIAEHLPHQKVHLYHPDGSKSVHFSADLLPYSFQSSSLKN